MVEQIKMHYLGFNYIIPTISSWQPKMPYHNDSCLRISYTSHPLNTFKKLVDPALEISWLQKYIWYANHYDTLE